jgi:amino acid transporter
MNLDDLKTVWKEEISYSVRMEDPSMTAIMNDVTRTKREVRLRDFWMIFALAVGALINVLFGWLAQEQVDWLIRLGTIAFVVGTAAVCVSLIRARSVARSDDWTLRSRIKIEIERLEKQSKLMNRVGAWFLMPMLIAISLSSLGGYHARTGSYVPDAFGCVFYAGTAVFYGFTYWLVRREVKNKWEPLLGRLRRLLADLSAESGAQVDTGD